MGEGGSEVDVVFYFVVVKLDVHGGVSFLLLGRVGI